MSGSTTGEAADPDEATRVEEVEPDPAADSLELLRTGIGVGERLGRFIILGKLGEGGMALVYAAYDSELDRKVAIKVLRGDSYGEHQTLGQARMLREAQTMARLSHPNIVQVYDVGKIGKGVFIAMEFVRGPNLRAWLRERPRGWPEVLGVFLQAGEGLAAAHDAGLVHRDFKPDNVLVGDDGRVRVLDFGLARPHEGAPPPVDADLESALRALESDRRRGSVELTRSGAYVGTPAYMAPEQQMLLPGDARSDQFAFCVSLFEGLFGARPFAGPTPADLRRNIVLGRIQLPARGPVPEWLRAAVLRGLANEPARRFAAMRDLLAALRSDPSGRRRRLALAALALLAGVALGWRALAGPAPRSECDHLEHRLVDVWDEPLRARISTAFAATSRPYAAESFARVSRDLQTHADAWVQHATATCRSREAADSEGSTTDELTTLCLERRRAELGALALVLARADATTVENASAAVDRLHDPALCADRSALAAEMARAPLPDDRTLAAAVWALRERLATIRFLELTGRYDEGLTHLDPILADARALAHPPVLAEALLARAILLGKKASYPAADAALLAALAEAERADHDALRAEALVHRIELVGFLAARPEIVDDWVEPTRALVRRIAPDSALEGRLLNNIGLMRYRQASYVVALAEQQQAVALLERVLGPGDPEFIRALLDLGRTTMKNGHNEESLRILGRARELAERELGPEHPLLIGIYLNIANLDYDHGEALYRRAIELSERAFGPDHPSGASAIANLGNTHFNRGRHAEAFELYSRAVGIYRRTIGVHTTTAMNLANLAEAATSLGRPDEALAALREGLEIFEQVHPEGDHPDMLDTLILLAGAVARGGRFDEARAHLERARRLAASAQNPSQPLEQIDLQLADLDLAEAQSLWLAGRRRDAVELAARGVDRLAPQVGDSAALRGKLALLRAWLAERRPAP